MQIDQVLLVVALAAYITGALVLVTYFLARYELLRSVGGVLAIVGCAAQFAELGARWAISGIWPLTNLYGSLSLFSAMGVLIFLIFAYRFRLWFAGGFVLLIAAIALGYATTWNEGFMPPVPALQSYWIKIHVPLVISAYASFMVSFVVSLLYLIKYYYEQYFSRGPALQAAAATGAGSVAVTARSEYATLEDEPTVRIGAVRADTPAITAAAANGNIVAQWLAGLPSLAQLDIMTYRIVGLGLPLLTIGIITGAMWAKESWGAYWQWDPKETAALVSWIVYAGYMHLHTRNAWRGLRSAWLSIFGFATIVFCYLGVNIWISGL
ncbi:MAG: c-type cytochrome biogenesis protein CcsB, partial [Candidatus Eremiobacteraeota bacterium]|nr:c-type cytochrome biogenesis protein CcsB [Candidatus Eremiobacteraeota bacterium]